MASKINFIHIGKTGGSAIKKALGREYITDDIHIVCHEHHFNFNSFPRGEKFFFVVRDPIDRFVSGFYSRMRQAGPAHNVPWTDDEKYYLGRFKTPEELASNIHKDHEAMEAMGKIAHISRKLVTNCFYWDFFVSREEFEARAKDLVMILEFDTLESDFETLKGILGIDPAIKLPKDEKSRNAAPKDTDRELSEESIKNLKEWYKDDYDFLEYLKENTHHDTT